VVPPEIGTSFSNKSEQFVQRDGELLGEIKAARTWYAIGQHVSTNSHRSIF
jgi:hypothetical protein